MTSSAAFNDNVSPFPGESRARLRASDANRAATVQTLQEAVGHGLLTYEEGSDRMAAAFAARFRDELPRLTADLPAVAAATQPPGWRRLGTMLTEQLRHEARLTRAAGLRSRRAAVAAVLLLILVTGMLLTLGGLFFGDDDWEGHGHPFEHHESYQPFEP
jgi:hypothetical protein